MNRMCTKLRLSLTSETLSDLMGITLNRDVALNVDIDTLIKSGHQFLTEELTLYKLPQKIIIISC